MFSDNWDILGNFGEDDGWIGGHSNRSSEAMFAGQSGGIYVVSTYEGAVQEQGMSV